MTTRMRVGVLFGGRSGEHEVSLRSAAAVIGALDPARYDVVPIAICKDGRWRTGLDTIRMLEEAQRDLRAFPEYGVEVTLPAEPTRRATIPLAPSPGAAPVTSSPALAVVFPVLHGPLGEDGTVQGLLELAGIPFVGAGVLGSALGMDKLAMKAAFRDAGIPVCRWVGARASDDPAVVRRRVEDVFGFPCFVKPANLGSSVGITKVKAATQLAAALDEAGAYDRRIIIEEAIDGREFECALLGNDDPEVSVVGELIPSREFYDYTDKYVETGVRIVIPAQIPGGIARQMQDIARQVFAAVDCAGLARVDFFLERGTDRVLVNEINTMPGFTRASMYPKMWEASGRSIAAVLDRLIELARARHGAQEARRRRVFTPPTSVSPATRSSSGNR